MNTPSSTSVPTIAEAFRDFVAVFDDWHKKKDDARVQGALNGEQFLARVSVFTPFFRRYSAYVLVQQGADSQKIRMFKDIAERFAANQRMPAESIGYRPYLQLDKPQEDPLDRAESCYRMALTLFPDCAPALFNLSSLMIARGGDVDEAVAGLDRAADLQPFYRPHSHLKAAFAFEDGGRNDEALQRYRSALADGAHFAQHQTRIAAFLRRMGAIDEALTQYERSLDHQHYYMPEFAVLTPRMTEVCDAYRSAFESPFAAAKEA